MRVSKYQKSQPHLPSIKPRQDSNVLTITDEQSQFKPSSNAFVTEVKQVHSTKQLPQEEKNPYDSIYDDQLYNYSHRPWDLMYCSDLYNKKARNTLNNF